MKAVVYDAPGSFTIKEIPTPDPKPGRCGYEYGRPESAARSAHPQRQILRRVPADPGHELIGPVDALGEGTEGFRVGEYVSVNPNMNCGHCEYCRIGRTLLCANLKGLGTNWPGSFAEYVVVPANLVFSVDGIDPDTSVFTEPTACAMHGVETLSPRPGSSALVFGAGPTGLLLSQLIARGGAVSVTVAASSAFKLKRAEALGIDTTFLMDRADLAGDAAKLKAESGGGFDIVVDATGSAAVSEQCVPLTRSGGTVMFYGVTEPEDLVRVSPYDVFRREITIKGSFAEINSFPAAIAALRTGRARTEGLITHRFTLDDYADALDALRGDRTVHKIIIECWPKLTAACTLGLDLGTSSAKAVVVDAGGEVLAQASAGYTVTSAAAGYAESEPAHWWSAVTACAREAVHAAGHAAGARPSAIGLSGQMHGLVLASADGEALRPALLWADSRATGSLRAYRLLGSRALARLANPLAPGMTGPMLVWIAENEPRTYAEARWALQPKDWLRACLTGEVHAEPSDASATLLYDVMGDRWDLEVVSGLGLEAGLLAPLLPSAGAPAGHLVAAAATELGLPAGIPVAAGAGDTAAAALGSGIGPGDIQLTVGTGAQVIRPITAPVSRADAGVNLYRSATPVGWYHMGATVSAGLSLNWVREVMNASWEELYASADHGGQAHDPIFVPHLSGERTPYSDPTLRGSWTALSLADDRASLLRSALEGTAFAIRDALDALLADQRPPRLRLAGGGTLAARLAAVARGRAGVAAACRGHARGVRPRCCPAGGARGRPAQLRRYPGAAGAARPPGGRTGSGDGGLPRRTPREIPADRLGPG